MAEAEGAEAEGDLPEITLARLHPAPVETTASAELAPAAPLLTC